MVTKPVGARVVIDTNVVESTLVFQTGRFNWLRTAWRTGQVVPVVAHETVAELVRVLAYPKFQLDEEEIAELLSDYLPFAEVAHDEARLERFDETMQVAGPHDQPFVNLAMSAGVDALVSGDAHVLALVGRGGLRVMPPDEFRRWFEEREN